MFVYYNGVIDAFIASLESEKMSVGYNRARRKRASALPLCIFPKGIEAGIRCASLTEIRERGKTIKICGLIECVYHEPLY